MPCHQSFLRQQGVPGAEQGWHQRRPLLLPVISISDARLTYLQRLCKVLLARCFPRCVCFMLNLVTFSPLEGNLVPCEPRLIILETFRLYSRLISCTRKISILHLEFKCVFALLFCCLRDSLFLSFFVSLLVCFVVWLVGLCCAVLCCCVLLWFVLFVLLCFALFVPRLCFVRSRGEGLLKLVGCAAGT